MLEMFRSALNRPDGARRDDGVALILAVMVGTFGVALTMVVVTTVIVGSKNSGRDRQRAVAISAAEAGVDASYAAVQGATASTLPCTVSVTSKGSDVTTVSSVLTYYDAAGAKVACSGQYVPASSAGNVVKAEIVSTATTKAASGITKATRRMEALADIKPAYTGTLDDALFSNAQMTFDNIGKVLRFEGVDANVYTNSVANCQNGLDSLIQGSVRAQGSVLISGPCKILGDLWVKGGITLNGENAQVGGDIKSTTQIDININNLLIGGRAQAPVVKKMGSTCTLSFCLQTSPVAAPTVKPFPIIRGDAAAQAVWQAAGYTVKTISSATCDAWGATGLNGPTDWLVQNAKNWTGKTLVVNTCANKSIGMQGANQIKLAGDLAIMSYAGFSSQTDTGYPAYTSKDGQNHTLHMIVPYDAVASAAVGTCTTPEIRLQQNSIDTNLTTLVYGPCDVAVSNSTTLNGQIYSGSKLNLNNGLTLHYTPVSMPAGSVVAPGGAISGFSLGVIYKREVRS